MFKFFIWKENQQNKLHGTHCSHHGSSNVCVVLRITQTLRIMNFDLNCGWCKVCFVGVFIENINYCTNVLGHLFLFCFKRMITFLLGAGSALFYSWLENDFDLNALLFSISLFTATHSIFYFVVMSFKLMTLTIRQNSQ